MEGGGCDAVHRHLSMHLRTALRWRGQVSHYIWMPVDPFVSSARLETDNSLRRRLLRRRLCRLSRRQLYRRATLRRMSCHYVERQPMLKPHSISTYLFIQIFQRWRLNRLYELNFPVARLGIFLYRRLPMIFIRSL